MTRELKFHVPEAEGDVSALVSIPDDVRFVYVLGHGAGATAHSRREIHGRADDFDGSGRRAPAGRCWFGVPRLPATRSKKAEGLGVRATMHIVEGGDHSFKVPKRSGRTEDEVFDELADTITDWVSELA